MQRMHGLHGPMRSLELNEQLIKLLPIILGESEFAMLTRIDVLQY